MQPERFICTAAIDKQCLWFRSTTAISAMRNQGVIIVCKCVLRPSLLRAWFTAPALTGLQTKSSFKMRITIERSSGLTSWACALASAAAIVPIVSLGAAPLPSASRRSKLIAPDFERLARTPWPIASFASSGISAFNSALDCSCSRKACRVGADRRHECLKFLGGKHLHAKKHICGPLCVHGTGVPPTWNNFAPIAAPAHPWKLKIVGAWSQNAISFTVTACDTNISLQWARRTGREIGRTSFLSRSHFTLVTVRRCVRLLVGNLSGRSVQFLKTCGDG